ncbi:hypothetical protein BCR42DRAFT_416498 [Absidia repens]|uniref:Uncharacterized protein n=1 Tax=Absidia repens TaxID=90262 RepID=A0A1X2IEL1_9FUNG|nr:hypothetical protein BCR42DRAFT_416498 [Absidia repens]
MYNTCKYILYLKKRRRNMMYLIYAAIVVVTKKVLNSNLGRHYSHAIMYEQSLNLFSQ